MVNGILARSGENKSRFYGGREVTEAARDCDLYGSWSIGDTRNAHWMLSRDLTLKAQPNQVSTGIRVGKHYVRSGPVADIHFD
jgi:hypothetical protein